MDAAPYASPMPLLTARGVRKSVGEGRASRLLLDGADLDLEPGEIVAILGRSGSGKSTFLNLVGGIDSIDDGSIEVDGRRIDQLDGSGLTRYRREQVGFVFQLFHLIPELTALQNVTLPARMAGTVPDGAARAAGLLERFGVAEVADQLPHTLSGGEQQRIAIARAMINDPPLILADEPTGNLDPAAAATVLDVLRGIGEEGRSVLLVTHERDATAIADRVVKLEDARFVTG